MMRRLQRRGMYFERRGGPREVGYVRVWRRSQSRDENGAPRLGTTFAMGMSRI